MTIVPPAAGEPRRPDGPCDPGDAWVIADDGTRYWGRFGAAGLLAVDRERGVLLQQRVGWSHFGGTWGTPGGAMHEGESAIDGALRESQEEAGVPDGAVRPLFTSVFDADVWTYTTLVAMVDEPFEPQITDPESVALEWVPVDDVDARELHPGFAASWPMLRAAVAEVGAQAPVVVVDVANVMGATPNGWWRDRAGAATTIVERLERVAVHGVRGKVLGLPGARWFVDVVAVVEGAARNIDESAHVQIVRAAGSGDDAVVAAVERAAGRVVHVVTSDRELGERAAAVGATVHGVRWLLDQVDALENAVADA